MPSIGLRVRRPYLLITTTTASIVAVNLICAAGVGALPNLPPSVLELLAEVILAVLAIALLVALQSWRKVDFRAFLRLRGRRLYWFPLFPVLPVVAAAMAGISRMHFEEVAFFLVLACLIGFVEEVFFRGLILQALVPTGLRSAALITSIVFG